MSTLFSNQHLQLFLTHLVYVYMSLRELEVLLVLNIEVVCLRYIVK